MSNAQRESGQHLALTAWLDNGEGGTLVKLNYVFLAVHFSKVSCDALVVIGHRLTIHRLRSIDAQRRVPSVPPVN